MKEGLAPHVYPRLARSRGNRQLPKAAEKSAKPRPAPAATVTPAEPAKPATHDASKTTEEP